MKDNKADTVKHKRINKDESDIKTLMDHWHRGKQHKKRWHGEEKKDNNTGCQLAHILVRRRAFVN